MAMFPGEANKLWYFPTIFPMLLFGFLCLILVLLVSVHSFLLPVLWIEYLQYLSVFTLLGSEINFVCLALLLFLCYLLTHGV